MRAVVRARNLSPLLALGVMLAGCSSSGPPAGAGHHGHFQAGRPNYTVAPYQVNGVWYYPKVDYSYDKTGTASWYGPGFDKRATADGETYDMNQLSAAHKTLPLPSVVEVTNLQNGRALRLRVNDRGPFIGDRLIDVSRRAAQLLGFEGSGTAPVRVQIMKQESIAVAEAAMRGEYGLTAVAGASSVAHNAVAAAAPPRERVQVAANGLPPSMRAQEVVAGPLPVESAPQPAPVVMALPPPREPPPPLRVAAAPRHDWPALIPAAHAETLRPVPAAAPLYSRGIFIQAGAFAMPENAQRTRTRIAAFGRTEIVSASHRGATLYVVRLGPVRSAAEAERLLGKIVGSGYPGARLVDE